MEYSVYILQSERDSQFYIGQSQNIYERIEFHNSGRVRSTKNKGPWRLFASKACSSRAESISIEKKLKNLRSRVRIIDFIHKNNFEMH